MDGKNYGNLPGGQNVFVAHDLSYGPHKIVVMAKNTAGQLVDRKELSVTTVETAASTTITQSEAAQPPAPAAPPPAPVLAPAPQYTAESSTLPQTATSYPLAAVAGLSLLAVGIVLRRKS